MNSPVWLYWEGPMPPYIRLCLDLLKAYNPNARVLGPDDLPGLGFSPELLDAIGTWHVCQRSDAIRAWLLAEHGGVWCDADCIPLKPFDLLARAAETSPCGLLAYQSTDRTIGVALFAARPGAEPIVRLRDHVVQIARSGRKPGWLEVSSQPMTRIVHEIGRQRCVILPFDHVSPISWRDQHLLSARAPEHEHAAWLAARPNIWTCMLSNQRLSDPAAEDDVPRLTRHELLSSDRLLSHVFRASVGRLHPPSLPAGRAVVTLNLYGDGMPHNLRESQRAAAERWGAEYVEITRPLFGWREPYWEKLNLDKHAVAYERVVYFDRDVVVRADCPNLFECVPAEAIGAVSSEQEGHNLLHHVVPKMQPLCDLLGVPLDFSHEYINSGVLVFSPHRHRAVFEAARLIWALTGDHSSWEIGDQGPLSLARRWTETPLCLLPSEFNRCGARLWDRWTPVMDAFIWHFCGSKNWPHMADTNWQTLP
ncbi:glycosyltransferase [Thermopirellula anaerolimosa]